MTPEESHFLRAIVAEPGDVMPRLIFADWLEENGHSYGIPDWEKRVAFVRDEGAMPLRFGSRHMKPTVRHWRCRTIKQSIPGLPVSYSVWDIRKSGSAFRGMDSSRMVWLVVRHGFIEEITLNQWAFIRCAKGLFENHPVREVWLTGQDPEWGIESLTLDGSPLRFAWQRFGATDNDTRIGSYPRTAVIPPIWNRLKRDLGSGRIDERYQIGLGGSTYAVYHSKESAYADLSQAAVSWGRSMAGLPALEGVMV